MSDSPLAVQTSRRVLDLAWFAVTTGTILWGLFILSQMWPHLTEPTGWWAIDSRRVLEVAGMWLSGGDPYEVYGFVYSPFALLAAMPFRLTGEWGWFAVEVVALVWIMLDASKGLGWPSRTVVVIAGMLFLPAMSDLLLGNVTIVLTALGLIAIRRNGVAAGVAFGIGLAAVPKPLFIPLIFWMLRYRRRSLRGTIAGGIGATAAGVLVLGVDRYGSFLSALATGAGIPSDFVGNLGLSALSPTLGVLGNVVALVAVGAGILFLSAESALMAASLGGVFMGTYAGLYAAVPLLISIPVLAAKHRRRALAIGGLSNGFVLAMPLFAAVSMVIGVVPSRRPKRRDELPSPVPLSSTTEGSGGAD